MGSEPGRLTAVIAGTAAVVGGLLGLALIVTQIVVFTNLFSPLVKEHCLRESASGALAVDSRWTLRVPWFAALDGDDCVRNSPLREGVAAVGLWGLGTPEEQVEDNITSRLTSQTQADYVRATLELRREFDPEIRRIANALGRAPTPARARQLVGELIEVLQQNIAELRRLDPPAEIARLHRFAIESTEEVVESLGALDKALRDNDPDAYLDAQLALVDKLQELQDRYDRLSEGQGTKAE